MYKITNKLTGFIQYRNSNEVADFIIMNSKKNTFYDLYKIEKIKEVDTEKYEEITYAILGGVCLSILITLFYFISL
jgi:bisphosphoglycerate-independent phosphoglycerate mutase (AlkP superfamily)